MYGVCFAYSSHVSLNSPLKIASSTFTLVVNNTRIRIENNDHIAVNVLLARLFHPIHSAYQLVAPRIKVAQQQPTGQNPHCGVSRMTDDVVWTGSDEKTDVSLLQAPM